MASLTYQQYNTKTLSGLSDTYSNNITCDTITVADNLTCSPGCTITLPNSSIQDSYLTSNVAFRNQVNAFTLGNSFAATTTHNGTMTNNGVSNFNSTVNILNGSIQNFFSSAGGSNSIIQQTSSGLQIVNGTSSQSIGLYTRTAGNVVGANLIAQNGNTVYLQGDPSNRITVSGITTPVLTIQAPALSNDFSIANTAWVVSQGYAKLAGPQTFTGNHNFVTQAISDNSTLACTTAYVKNQNYITAAALTPYALLAPPSGQTFTGLNYFPTQANSDNSTLACTTAFVKNQGYAVLGSSNVFLGSNNRFESFGANLAISFKNTDVPTYAGGVFVASGNGQYNANTFLGDTVFMSTGTSASNTGALNLTTWSSTNCGIRITSNLVTHNGPNHNFNGNISLGLYNLDVLNSGRTRGMRIANNGSNNGVTDITGVGVSTRFNFFSNDGAGTPLNNFYIANSNTCYLQGASGLGIGMVGSAISLDGVCSFTNTITPVITQSISLADNSNKIPTTSWINGQSYLTSSSLTPYALLNPTSNQTFAGTGVQSFTNTAIFTNGLDSNSNITLFSGALSSNIRQNTNGIEITNVDLSKYIQLITRTPAGGNTIGVCCANGNSAYIQGDTGAQISITNQQANIGGSAPPTISTNPFNSDNSNKIASTSFVKNQNYASLNPSALQIWGTNENQFNTQINMNATPIRFVDGLRSSKISQSGTDLIIENISNVSSVQLRSTTASLVQRTGIMVRNGNETIIQGGSTGIIRVLGNDATIECDNFKSNAPFECGYLQLGTPITAKTNYDIGYQWSIQGSSFNSWSGFTAYGNVYTLAWNGTGDRTLGVWLCDICIATNTTSAMDSGFVLNIANNFVINTRSAWSNALTSFGVNQAQIVRLSCVLNITNLTDTYYLNFKINGGSARTDVPGASQMLFTRIA